MEKTQKISAAWKFADLVCSQKREEINRSAQLDIAALQNKAAAQGTILSGGTLKARMEILGNGSRAITLAYLEGLLEGCDQSDLEIDDDVESRIVDDVVSRNDSVRERAGQAVNSIPVGLWGSMRSRPLEDALIGAYRQAADVSKMEVQLAVKRKRHLARKTGVPETVNNYHLNATGPNARVNMNSTDNSANTVITKETVFAQVREVLATASMPENERQQILQRLDDLEASKGSKSYTSRLVEFLQVSANIANITPLLAQCLPKLLEWGKSLVG